MNWAEANQYCDDIYGTVLATITNDIEATLLLETAQALGQDLWIGLNDIDVEGAWQWTSGHSWLC